MYLEGRPVSTFQPTPGWSIPLSPGTGTLKRPPIGNNNSSTASNARKPPVRPPPPTTKSSSSSSLSGLEQNVPPFQDFLKQTAPLEHSPNEPLPPTPRVVRSQSSLRDSFRRSSSVYSRTQSQWFPESEASWRTEDLEDYPLPTLKAIAYSVSTPDLKKGKDAEPQLLEPRVFEPLIASPTISIVTTPSSPPQSRPITELLPSTAVPVIKRQKVQMLSLEKAQEAMNVPGAALLPEEMRAQALSKAKSQGQLCVPSAEIFAASQVRSEPANKILSTTLVDKEGRFRLIRTPPSATAQLPEYPFPAADAGYPADSDSRSGRPISERTPSGNQSPFTQVDEEERGRPQERGRRSRDVKSFTFPPEQGRALYDANMSQSQGSRDASASSAYDSDDSIRTHMKMVPQPLFSGKLPAKASGNLRGSASSGSVLHRRSLSQGSMSSSGAGSSRFPLRLSVSPPQSRHTSGGSNFGHIPISPPSAQPPARPSSPPANTRPQVPRPKKSHRRDKSQSQFYPHIMGRSRSRPKIESKKSDKKGKKQAEKEPQVPGVPLLAADIVAQRLQTPNTSPMTSSPVTPSAPTHKPTPSDGSENGKRPLFQRMAQGVTNFGRRRSSADRDPSPSSRASPASPHLYPTSSKSNRPPHLGWSDSAKFEYDEAMTPPQTPRSNSKAAYAAQRLDERLASIDLPDSPMSPRKPSLNVFGQVGHQVGHFLDTLHENKAQNKAQKQREALKKMIRVVPNESGRPSEEGGKSVGRASGESGRRPSLLSQKLNWL